MEENEDQDVEINKKKMRKSGLGRSSSKKSKRTRSASSKSKGKMDNNPAFVPLVGIGSPAVGGPPAPKYVPKPPDETFEEPPPPKYVPQPPDELFQEPPPPSYVPPPPKPEEAGKEGVVTWFKHAMGGKKKHHKDLSNHEPELVHKLELEGEEEKVEKEEVTVTKAVKEKRVSYSDESSELPEDMSDIDGKDLSRIPLPPKRNEGGKDSKLYNALHSYFLSPLASTDKQIPEEKNSQKQLSPEEITKILNEFVVDLDRLFDRSGDTPVVQIIISTYFKGLPIFQQNETLQIHTIQAMSVIFHKLPRYPKATASSLFSKLANSFTSCQMEQGRTIDSIYGFVIGREKTLKEQILSVVDLQKDRILNQVVNYYNPDAWKVGDDQPEDQVPHIQSSYCVAIGVSLGLRGVKVSSLDRDALTIDQKNTAYLKKCFKRLFLIQELLDTIVQDVNQQDQNVERLINLQSLMSWSGDNTQNQDFDSYSIFYDEDNKQNWPPELGKPKDENKFLPFLSHQVALKLLLHLFLDLK